MLHLYSTVQITLASGLGGVRGRENCNRNALTRPGLEHVNSVSGFQISTKHGSIPSENGSNFDISIRFQVVDV